MKRRLVFAATALSVFFLCAASYAGPVELSAGDLDRVTAAGAEYAHADGSGGAIVANESDGFIATSGEVDISGESQSGAKALNLVNATESTVANGLNIWDGNVAGPAVRAESAEQTSGAGFTVNQSNDIVQEQRRSARLSGYDRLEPNVHATGSESGESTRNATNHKIHNKYDLKTNEYENNVSSNGNLDTTSHIQLDHFSNILGTELDGLEIGINGGQGGVAAGAVAYQRDGSEFNITLDGFADIPGVLEFSRINPTVSVDFTGTMCFAQGGSCDGTGSTLDKSSSVRDLSDLLDESSSEQTTGSHSSEFSKDTLGPLQIEKANAEYIVVDGSTLDVTTSNAVRLSGSAQSNVNGINVVNAAGSSVANGVNISRTAATPFNGPLAMSTNAAADSAGLLRLNQSNVIVHSR